MLGLKDQANQKIKERSLNGHGNQLGGAFVKNMARLMMEDLLNLVNCPKFDNRRKEEVVSHEVESRLDQHLLRRPSSPSTINNQAFPDSALDRKNEPINEVVGIYRRNSKNRHGFNSRVESRLHSPQSLHRMSQGHQQASYHPRESFKSTHLKKPHNSSKRPNLYQSQPREDSSMTEISFRASQLTNINTKRINHWETESDMSLYEDSRLNPQNVDRWHDIKSPEKNYISKASSRVSSRYDYNFGFGNEEGEDDRDAEGPSGPHHSSENQSKMLRRSGLSNQVSGPELYRDLGSPEKNSEVYEEDRKRMQFQRCYSNVDQGLILKGKNFDPKKSVLKQNEREGEQDSSRIQKTKKKKAQRPFFVSSTPRELNPGTRFGSVDVSRRDQALYSSLSRKSGMGVLGVANSNSQEKGPKKSNPLKRTLKKGRNQKRSRHQKNTSKPHHPSTVTLNHAKENINIEEEVEIQTEITLPQQFDEKGLGGRGNSKEMMKAGTQNKTKGPDLKMLFLALSSESVSQFRQPYYQKSVTLHKRIQNRIQGAGVDSTGAEEPTSSHTQSMAAMGPGMSQKFLQKLYNSTEGQSLPKNQSMCGGEHRTLNTAKLLRNKSEDCRFKVEANSFGKTDQKMARKYKKLQEDEKGLMKFRTPPTNKKEGPSPTDGQERKTLGSPPSVKRFDSRDSSKEKFGLKNSLNGSLMIRKGFKMKKFSRGNKQSISSRKALNHLRYNKNQQNLQRNYQRAKNVQEVDKESIMSDRSAIKKKLRRKLFFNTKDSLAQSHDASLEPVAENLFVRRNAKNKTQISFKSSSRVSGQLLSYFEGSKTSRRAVQDGGSQVIRRTSQSKDLILSHKIYGRRGQRSNLVTNQVDGVNKSTKVDIEPGNSHYIDLRAAEHQFAAFSRNQDLYRSGGLYNSGNSKQ